MKTSTKKLRKKVVVKGKQKVAKQKEAKPVDKAQALLIAAIKKSGKEDYFHSNPNSAAHRLVKYYLENPPKVGKVYKASVVLAGYDRKEPFARRNVQLAFSLIWTKLKMVAVEWVKGFKNKWTVWKIVKKG